MRRLGMWGEEKPAVAISHAGFEKMGGGVKPPAASWSRRRESNPDLTLRRGPFYPLNYGEQRRLL